MLTSNNAVRVQQRFGYLLLMFLVGSHSSDQTMAAAERPNILILLADDLGYGDLACYGHPRVKTPYLDQLAAEGMKLTDCYAAAPNCSPSRTGLMTGRTPWRVGVHNWIPMLSPMHVPASEITIAKLLKENGYLTGHFGKWHLNGMFNLPGQPQPDDHGFEHWFSTQNNALPNHKNPWNFVLNGIPVGPQQGFSAQLIADEMIRWLKEDWNREQPFFAFVCFHEPHEPIASAPEFSQHYAGSTDPSLPAHHGNVTQLDAGVGQILKALDQLKLTEDTFVFFTSDNGPAITSWHPHGSTGGLRDKKGAVYEGGIRVPGLLRWPGKIPAGSLCQQPIIGTDLLPTICELTDMQAPPDRDLDGASILPLLTDPQAQIHRQRPLYWHFLRANSDVKVAIREGDWKLTATIDTNRLGRCCDYTPEEQEFYQTAELAAFQLFHLRDDPAETNDLSDQESARFKALQQTLKSYYQEVRDQSPRWPEWTWPKYESERIQWPDYHPPNRSKKTP